jgi:hypothetical protein
LSNFWKVSSIGGNKQSSQKFLEIKEVIKSTKAVKTISLD